MGGPVRKKKTHRRPGGERVGTSGRVGDTAARKAPHSNGGKRREDGTNLQEVEEEQDKRGAEAMGTCQLVASWRQQFEES